MCHIITIQNKMHFLYLVSELHFWIEINIQKTWIEPTSPFVNYCSQCNNYNHHSLTLMFIVYICYVYFELFQKTLVTVLILSLYLDILCNYCVLQLNDVANNVGLFLLTIGITIFNGFFPISHVAKNSVKPTALALFLVQSV